MLPYGSSSCKDACDSSDICSYQIDHKSVITNKVNEVSSHLINISDGCCVSGQFTLASNYDYPHSFSDDRREINIIVEGCKWKGR